MIWRISHINYVNDKRSRIPQRVLIYEKYDPEGCMIKAICPIFNNNNFSDTNQLHDIALVKLDRPILQEEWDNLNGQSGPEYIRDDFVNYA